MLFNSYEFLIFFPIVALAYYILPRKVRWVWLLVASYYFYMGWNAKYALLLFSSTLITYLSGLLIGILREKKPEKKTWQNWIVAISFISNIGILFFYKYFDFAVENINLLLGKLHMELLTPDFDVLLPVGISFYIFQALSYTMDVYRGEIEPEQNFFKYALFVSFFPQLVAGPIERSKNLLKQIHEDHPFEYKNVTEGFLLMIWGYFLKMVLADRIAIFVDGVYGNLAEMDGSYILLASVLFAFQIYGDFAGYSTIAIGAAKVMGFNLMENFNCPYMAGSVTEFWKRWHISLTSWFRDYLYIPLGGNRKGKLRKCINVMIVFLVSGLWHGANWTYVIWGGLNGIFQVIESFLPKIKNKIVGGVTRPIRMAITFVLVDFTWIFFRASTLVDAKLAITQMLHNFHWSLVQDGTYLTLSLDRMDFIVLGLSLLVLVVADILKFFHVPVKQGLVRVWFPVRWAVMLAAIWLIVIVGVWGSGYAQTNFLYFQF